MSERGMPGEGPPACPFIAFEDERDERSSSPDHRHRCFAEVTPAPRALAHQEAYCLSSAFPVCPTFQDWARREAAQARAAGRSPSGTAGIAVAVVAETDERADQRVEPDDDEPEDDGEAIDGAADDLDDLWVGSPSSDLPARRNPPRDWAAPPPWATGGPAGSAAAAGAGGASGTGGRSARDERSPEFLASRAAGAGLAGSAADRLASGQPVTARPAAAPPAATAPSSPPSDDLAGLVAPAPARAATREPPLTRPPSGAHPTSTASGRRPTVSSTRTRNPGPDHDGPSWETARRYEAYPTIKTRTGLPGIPRVLLWVGVLAIAAAALFFLPDILDRVGGGGGAAPTASPSASLAATAEPSATPVAEPTPQTYTIKKGDTLNKIAKKNGITLDQLLAANKKTIKDPNKITVGQVIIIPVPVPDEFTDASAAPSGEPAASEAPAP